MYPAYLKWENIDNVYDFDVQRTGWEGNVAYTCPCPKTKLIIWMGWFTLWMGWFTLSCTGWQMPSSINLSIVAGEFKAPPFSQQVWVWIAF